MTTVDEYETGREEEALDNAYPTCKKAMEKKNRKQETGKRKEETGNRKQESLAQKAMVHRGKEASPE